MNWSERQIASYLARITFAHKHLVIVPNCSWPGAECDLLVVSPNLRIIDVEIKISRSDLKADAKKDKWFHNWDWKTDGQWQPGARGKPRPFPRRVWKHYYCLPQEIWTPEMLHEIQPVSGILLLRKRPHRESSDFYVYMERMAKPNREAERISPEDAIDIARLASMRMWSAFALADQMRSLFERKAA